MRSPPRWAVHPRRTERRYAVMGSIALWGRVVEHADGYRAEHAMIRRLVVPRGIVMRLRLGLCGHELPGVYVDDLTGPPLVEELGRRYGVDVNVGEEIEMTV